MAKGETVLCRSSDKHNWGEVNQTQQGNFNPFSYPDWEWKIKTNPIKDAFESTVEKQLPDLLELPVKEALYKVFDTAFKEGVTACQNGEYY